MFGKNKFANSFVLCADDLGMSRGVNKAIFSLCEHQRISATSCMVHGPFWKECIVPLKAFSDSIDIGLHLTLTDQDTPLSLPKLAPSGHLPAFGSLLVKAYTKTLPMAEIRHSIRDQIKTFQDTFGANPAYIDGHQYTHQFPGVREALMEAIMDLLEEEPPYIRVPCDTCVSILKRGISPLKSCFFSITGLAMKRLVDQHNLRRNFGFSGIYRFDSSAAYEDLFAHFVTNLSPGTIIVCHPGLADHTAQSTDVIAIRREEEYRFFMSEKFVETLEQKQVQPSRFG